MFEFLTVFETFAYGFPWPLGGSGGPNLSEVGGCGSFFLFGCVTSRFCCSLFYVSNIVSVFILFMLTGIVCHANCVIFSAKF